MCIGSAQFNEEVTQGEVRYGKHKESLCACLAGLRVTLEATPKSNLFSVRPTRKSGQPGNAEKHTGTCRAERSGPGAEDQAFDSLLYPLAIGGHFIQCILHADAHILNGIKLVHEALSFRVLQ